MEKLTAAMKQHKMTRSELKRQAILEAAREAFQQYGVQGTSMDKLAAMAQVSKRTVYNHFATKEALVMHLMRDMWQRMMQAVEIRYNREEPLVEQLAALIRAEMQLLSCPSYLELARVAFGHYFYHHAALQQELEKFSKQETAIYRWLEEAIADAQLKPMDTDFAAFQLYYIIKGHCFWMQMMKVAEPPDEQQQQKIAFETAAMFLSYYRQEQASPEPITSPLPQG